MSTKTCLVFKTARMDEEFRPLCTDVLAAFRLPNRRLLCFFDDVNPPSLREQHGDFHGVHTPIAGSGDGWPDYVKEHFGLSQANFAFDNLIYVPGSRYAERRDSLALIFAHEVQHFMQWSNDRRVYEVNSMIADRWNRFPQLKVWEVPHEADAMQRSKQVVGAVMGNEAVEAFTVKQIDDAVESDNAVKLEMWQFFRSLPWDGSRNICEETLVLLAKYKGNLQEMPARFFKLANGIQRPNMGIR